MPAVLANLERLYERCEPIVQERFFDTLGRIAGNEQNTILAVVTTLCDE
jgi:hypothetical protein